MKSNPEKRLNVISNIVRGKNYLTRYNETYELDEVGLRIWELCDGSHTVEEIAEILTKEYDVAYEKVLADCQEYVEDLTAKGLLE
ncbi:MAG TPA: PqqD family protein [Ktedonosporobacter sp.]|nr:PqqD family protein [Ktedonosporobacter sp.]